MRIKMKHLSCILLLVYLLSMLGCTTDSQRIKFEATAIGAAIGATAGTVAGKEVGDEKVIKLIGGVLGAGLGAGVGFVYGSSVAAIKSVFAKEEDFLNACIKSAHRINDEIGTYNASLRSEIQNLEKRSNLLISLYNANLIVLSDLSETKTIIEEEIYDNQERLKRTKEKFEILNKILVEEKNESKKMITLLNAEVNKLDKLIRELYNQIQTLKSINRRIQLL